MLKKSAQKWSKHTYIITFFFKLFKYSIIMFKENSHFLFMQVYDLVPLNAW